MTNEEFTEAVTHQTEVLNRIREILKFNGMSLHPTEDGEISLSDDRLGIGYTGFHL